MFKKQFDGIIVFKFKMILLNNISICYTFFINQKKINVQLYVNGLTKTKS